MVFFFESFFDGFFGFFFLGRFFEGFRGNGIFERFEFEYVLGGEEVGVVDDFDERFNFGLMSDLFFVYVFGYFEGVFVILSLVEEMGGGKWIDIFFNVSNNGVGVRLFFGFVVLLFDDDDFFVGLMIREDDSDFFGFVD